MGIRKYLSGDGLVKIVQRCVLREKFNVLKNSTYNWKDCVMSGLAIFGFKMPSLLQFEKDTASEPTVRRNLRTFNSIAIYIDISNKNMIHCKPNYCTADCLRQGLRIKKYAVFASLYTGPEKRPELTYRLCEPQAKQSSDFCLISQ